MSMTKSIAILFVIAVLFGGLVGFTVLTKRNGIVPKNETANWRPFSDDNLGISFKYPSHWSFNKYTDGVPSLQIRAQNTGAYGVEREDDDFQKAIANGSAPNVIPFAGGKGSLSITCFDLGAKYPMPSYGFAFFNRGRVILLRVDDLSVNLEPGSKMCSKPNPNAGYPYLRKILPPNKVMDSKYEVYDDFISLIQNTLIIK